MAPLAPPASPAPDSNSKKIKVSKNEIEKIVWNKLWILRSRGFKMEKKDFALWPNNVLNLLQLFFGVYYKT